ncbi:MAG TPA: hypothetical protein DDY43_09790 [Synechococcales bacterium UBA10510]|nr:hypothetical protein [Synechococcales bacterium UBA10510]
MFLQRLPLRRGWRRFGQPQAGLGRGFQQQASRRQIFQCQHQQLQNQQLLNQQFQKYRQHGLRWRLGCWLRKLVVALPLGAVSFAGLPLAGFSLATAPLAGLALALAAQAEPLAQVPPLPQLPLGLPQLPPLPQIAIPQANFPQTALPQASLSVLQPQQRPLPQAGSGQRRLGVWLTNSPSPLYYDRDRIEQAVAELAEAGFNTLYPNVWSRGTTFHRSSYAPMELELQRVNPNLDPICRFTSAAHRRGLQVIPWFEYGLMEPADAEVVQRHPDWLQQRLDGSSTMTMHGKPMVWLNPAHPQVRRRFISLIAEIVQRCSVDGIQLDDHFAWPVELGYDPYTRALYRSETGSEPPANANDRFWMRWRRQQLTGLLRELRQRLQQLDGQGQGKRRVISLSPGPFRFAYNTWLQDWELWSLGGLVDELVVQNYAYSVEGFARDLQQPALLQAKQWGLPVDIGILAGFGGRASSMATVAETTRLALESGHGVIYFYWEGLWGVHAGPEAGELRRSGFRDLFKQS